MNNEECIFVSKELADKINNSSDATKDVLLKVLSYSKEAKK